jgi:GTPase
MFVDYAKVHLKAGDGGDGCISFRREKYVPRGGPNGGDGGRGGDIFLVADPNMATLLDFRQRAQFTTRRGGHGEGSNCTGRDAEDLDIHVPLGTAVSTPDGEEVADLVEPGQRWLAAKGGRGGKGNQHFASATNKAPRKFEYGGEGEEKALVLELKVIADVGIVGLPNAGKSTLLAWITAATPKIASYPFTTVHPNLGVMLFDDESRCTLADIPGLIEGAHMGAGLGHRFLRHIERTTLLLHLVAPPETAEPGSAEDYLYAYDLVNQELRAHSQELAAKPQVVALTKADLLDPAQVSALQDAFGARGITPLVLSAKSGKGLDTLTDTLRAELLKLHPPDPPEEEENP